MTTTENTESNPMSNAPEDDLHEALSLSILAILRMQFSAWKRLDAEQNAEIKRRLADGTGKLALFVTNDGAKVEASLAVVAADVQDVFTGHLIKLHGPILTAITPAEAVNTVNLLRLN